VRQYRVVEVMLGKGLGKLTGVERVVSVLLALVEAGLLLLLLELGVADGALVTGLVDLGVTDVGLSRHYECGM
jgi:hypothetical protein